MVRISDKPVIALVVNLKNWGVLGIQAAGVDGQRRQERRDQHKSGGLLHHNESWSGNVSRSKQWEAKEQKSIHH